MDDRPVCEIEKEAYVWWLKHPNATEADIGAWVRDRVEQAKRRGELIQTDTYEPT
jgi:hypothetical protein